MRLTNRKLGAFVAGGLAALAIARYAVDYIGTPPASQVDVPECRSSGANNLPPSCVTFDPTRFGFAALRGM